MSRLKKLQEKKPTKYKSFFKNHKIPIANVANELGVHYVYCCNMLNGHMRITEKNRKILDDLVKSIEIEVYGISSSPW